MKRVGVVKKIVVMAMLAATSACASNPSVGAAPAGASSSFAVAGGVQAQPITGAYKIGPLDRLNITVFRVPELSLQGVQVDGSGRIFLPLIGSVDASGKTTQDLSLEIANRLRGQYIQEPQVAVSVAEAVSQKVTVDGSVVEPGVYTMSGPTTLLQAVAMAKGPDARVANLSRVAVFRNIGGQRNVAVFDLKAIRAGKAEDPVIMGNDVIVVEGSAVKGALREVLNALPGLSIFRPY